MRTRPRLFPFAFAAVALGCLWAVPASATLDGAKAWLERMATATRALNYDGTFVYQSGESMQSMRIIHRADPDGARERLVALTGAPREVLRDRAQVICILPDDRTVVVGKSRPTGVAPSPSFEPLDGFMRSYDLSTRPGGRVAGRETRLIEVRPRDAYRYGYDLSVDTDTGLLLRSPLRAPDDTVLERIEFTSIDTPASIPDSLLEPSISSEGFTLYANPPATSPAQSDKPMHWQTTWVPDGFEMAESGADLLPASRRPVEQFVYSDGLASLSVFIERLEQTADELDGLSSMGAVNAYGRMIGDYQITVVGEVPAETVRKVALAVEPL